VSRIPRRRLPRLLVASILCVPAALATSGTANSAARSGARLGPDLLLNGDAAAGAVSVQGWDAVTIPGWRVLSGLPTVVRYGTPGFPRTDARSARPARLFAGGAGGTARLEQTVSLRSPRGGRLSRATRYRLSAVVGGTTTSAASTTVTFMSSSGRALGHRTIGPVGKRALSSRVVSGQLPPGSVSAKVVLRLATSLKNIDGANAPTTGYNRAVAGAVSLRVTARTQQARLIPPVAHVPHFDHVFLFMFENQDLRAVIGNRRQAPFLNGLLPRSSLLADMFAEEHPSDGNYLALSAGGVFGIPLTDPLEENPQYTINAFNIGDLIDRAHETWKAYLQSAAGPCDDTVHRYYWNDDLPFLYFADVRNRPAYCAAHLPPLDALQNDLASAATTPNFVWIGPDDCSDMEGCGIRAGDTLLKQELGAILSSPAWRTQRSLAIITFDEDGYDHERPAQRIPTLILGSAGVRAGYVSHVRYTHYSLLRTIEAALGLGTLTDNDRYAQPLNDVFNARLANAAMAGAPRLAVGPVAPAARRNRATASFTPRPRSSGRPSPTAFVANSASASVIPVSLVTGKAGRAIRVGSDPEAIAATPDGRTVYVVNSGSGTVTPIDTSTEKPGASIQMGRDPAAIAVTPDGTIAYVVNTGSDTVTPIDTATDTPGTPIPVGSAPRSIAITPDGKTAYVLDWRGATVTPIETASGRAGPPIPVGSYPSAIAINASGSVAYVAAYGSDTVTPIDIADDQPGAPVAVGGAPNALAVTPDDSTVDVVSGDTDSVDPITVSTGASGRPIRVGYSPLAVAMGGPTAYVVNTISGTVTPVSSNGRTSRPISVGTYSYPTAIAIAPGDRTAAVVDTYSGQLSLVNLRSRHAAHPITVGGFPVAVAIAG
jgi:YVTN family beta-propeller protein